jgi:hypothetical protein
MDAVHGLEPKNIEKKVLAGPRANVRDMQEEKVGCVVEGYERGQVKKATQKKVNTKAHQFRERIQHLLMEHTKVG